jgi:hypothetical protein
MESKSVVAILVAGLVLAGCYGEPRLPEPGGTVEQTLPVTQPPAPDRQGVPSFDEPGAQDHRMQELTGVLDRLGSPDDTTASEARDGAATWRPSELGKLNELCELCCRSGSAPCRQCLGAVADARLPADELWPLEGRFLQDLRPWAEDAAVTLGTSLLLRDNGVTRDRAFRIIVGSGAALRGEPDSAERRASTVPRVPAEGERVWLVVEQPAPCPNVSTDLKGPTAAGRWDLDISPACPEPAVLPDDLADLRATRIVWAFDAGPLSTQGLQLWVGDDAPLIEVKSPAPGPIAKP